jgi:hypothetical protein
VLEAFLASQNWGQKYYQLNLALHSAIRNSISLCQYLLIVTFVVASILFYVSVYNHRGHVFVFVIAEDNHLKENIERTL